MNKDDPTGDIYKILDKAGLNAGNLLDSKQPMSRIVNSIRTKITADFKEYIERREKRPRKIEIDQDDLR